MLHQVDGRMEPSFPNAEYYVQKGELENALTKTSLSYNKPALEHLRRSGALVLLEGNGRINDQITYELTGAHCEFHEVFLVEADGKKCFFGGDVLPEPIQLIRNFIAKYDLDGRKAMELRKHYGMLAAEQDWYCLFYHAADKAVGKVIIENGAFQVIEVDFN
jgi:hypothetical protein